MSETMYSDNLVLTCLFSQAGQVAVEDGKLRVRGDFNHLTALDNSVEADGDFEMEVDYEAGHFQALVDGPIRKDSHPFKYRILVDDEEDDDEPYNIKPEDECFPEDDGLEPARE